MKRLWLIIPTFLFACTSKKQALLKQQEDILEQIVAVKAAYFATTDSLDQLKRNDTASSRQHELMEAIISAEKQKSKALLQLEKRYHVVELKLRNYQE